MADTPQHKKFELIQWLSTFDDISIIEKIIHLRKTETLVWWREISTAEKESIEKGMADANAGRLKPHSEARKLYGNCLLNQMDREFTFRAFRNGRTSRKKMDRKRTAPLCNGIGSHC